MGSPRGTIAVQEGMEPKGLGLIVCDWIHRDPGTGKLTLLGTFANVISQSYPFALPVIAVYGALTECLTPCTIRLQIIDVNEEREPIAKVENPCEMIDPLGVVEMHFVIGGITFPEPGEYRVQLFADNTFIMDRRIVAVKPEVEDDAHEQ